MNIKFVRTAALAASLFLVPTSFQAAFAADFGSIATSSLEKVNSATSSAEEKVSSATTSAEDKVSSVSSSANSSKIDINSASVEELTSVSGIGTSIAEKIVEYREQYGDFTDLADLTNISGIGSATLAKILPYLSL
ncbi:ComEA family DNA-binding protein [Psychromonas sp. GE-S-Ul-11]|uniref:ComEA family DNA-binding protein n=1 Tax=Psychromonas sp. GE-S-Ul-11 TaxID=3241170 RepID=UPI00390C9F81